jgi:DNA-binding transcriptional ArsR family regulator
MGEKKSIPLRTEAELRIFMMPLRQKLLHEMAVMGTPVTGKHLADRLGITPSSAHHHIRKLESIGLIELDRFELVGSINARYVRLVDADVSIGLDETGELGGERDAILLNMVNEAYAGFKRSVARAKARKRVDNTKPNPLNDLTSSVVHFTNEQAEAFYKQLRTTLDSHATPGPGTKPWDILFIAYENDPVGMKKGAADANEK